MSIPTADTYKTATTPYVVEDCRGILQLLSDGTTIRSAVPLMSVSFPDVPTVEHKDAVYDTTHNLLLRMYKPSPSSLASNAELPVLVYFHGGGFCIGSYEWSNNHYLCQRMAAEFPALVVSADYRLAPEHRLPAAIDDAAAVLTWLREKLVGPGADQWLAGVAVDCARVFVAGESAGGDIVHHMAVRFGPDGLKPLKIAGFVQVMPSFVGTDLTPSERECPPDAFLNREMWTKYGKLALPVGATMDHWTLNPFGPESVSLEAVDMGRVLVITAEHDILRDRNVEYVKRLTTMGKQVELVGFDGEEHAFFSLKPRSPATDEVIRVIKRFVGTAAGSS